jgi:phage/plasmid-associated DNA primase
MFAWLRDKLQSNVPANKATHFYHPTKSYFNVGLDEQAGFWETYTDSIQKGENPYISELTINKDTVQLVFDIKLSFERQQIPNNFEEINILIGAIDLYVQSVIGTIQSLLCHYFETSEQTSELIVAYLKRNEKEVLTWNTNTVDFAGRLVFPYARLQKEHVSKFHHFILYELQLSGDSPDNQLHIAPINGLDTFIQPPQDFIELYGSSIGDDDPKLNLFEIYGYLNTDVKTTFELSKVFSPTFHSIVSQGLINIHMIQQKVEEKGMEYWLPLFFSHGYHDVALFPKEGTLLVKKETPKVNIDIIKEGGEIFAKLDRARQLLALISSSRVEEDWSWLDLGQALYSIDQTKEGLDLWKWITKSSDFKTEEDCDIHWSAMDPSQGIDIETLEYFAMTDNPQQFEIFRESEVRKAIERAIDIPEHTPVAEAFHACYPYDYVCSNYEASSWYYYTNHRWVSIDGTSTLMENINRKFKLKLEKIQHEISAKIAGSKDDGLKNQLQQRMSLIGQLILKLCKNGFKEGLCKELRLYYHKPEFERLKDANIDLMATPSGVVDVRGGVGLCRQGKPQDYVSRTTRYGYPKDMTWQHPSVKMVKAYIKKVFRSKPLRKYFWRFMASLLKSGNSEKIFPIFSGQGNNSKSMLVKLIEMAFGNYAVKLPTSLITEKRTAADSATPTLIHSQGAKVAFLEEPNKKEVIQSGTVKHITGRDSQYVRDLFQKGSKIVEMNITIVPILVANKIPEIPDCQEAIWNRTRVIDFLSKWSKDAPDDETEQFVQGVFKMDRFFDRQIPLMAPAFLWMCVQYFSEYSENGMDEPPEVLQATENFRVHNNVYINFIRDSLTQVLTQEGKPDSNYKIHIDEMYTSFKMWWKNQELTGKIPKKTDFKEDFEITTKVKADSENKWSGLRLTTPASTMQQILSF